MTGTVAQVVGPHVVTRPGPHSSGLPAAGPLMTVLPVRCRWPPTASCSPDGGPSTPRRITHPWRRCWPPNRPPAAGDYRVRLVEGNAARLEWSVDAGDAVVDDGGGSFSSSTGASSLDPPESGTNVSDARAPTHHGRRRHRRLCRTVVAMSRSSDNEQPERDRRSPSGDRRIRRLTAELLGQTPQGQRQP